MLEALGSTSRLRLVKEMTAGPRYVSELAERTGLDGSATAHHLAVLEDADLVEPYWTGQRKYYRLTRRIELTASPDPERTFVLSTTDVGDAGPAAGD